MMALSWAPRISSGAKLSVACADVAPISRNGPMTRFMGALADPSPVSFEENGCPAKNSREQPHGRAGIAGVERAPTALTSRRSRSRPPNCVLVGFDFGTQCSHARQRAVAIRRRGKMRNSLVPSASAAASRSGGKRIYLPAGLTLQ